MLLIISGLNNTAPVATKTTSATGVIYVSTNSRLTFYLLSKFLYSKGKIISIGSLTYPFNENHTVYFSPGIIK